MCMNLRGLESQTLTFNGITYALNQVASGCRMPRMTCDN
jgi:hypothetical protein